MSWSICIHEDPDEGESELAFDKSVVHLVVRNGTLHAFTALPIAVDFNHLGSITPGRFGAKLEAKSEPLTVTPRHDPTSPLSEPPAGSYQLNPLIDGNSEAIILRHGDRIASVGSDRYFSIHYKPPEILVNSSATAFKEACDITESEVRSDEDGKFDKPASPAPPASPPSARSMTHVLAQQSELVQETPTISRMRDLGSACDVSSFRKGEGSVVNAADSQQPFSTAPTQQTKVGAFTEQVSELREVGETQQVDETPQISQPQASISQQQSPKHLALASPKSELESPNSNSTSSTMRATKHPQVQIPMRSTPAHKRTASASKLGDTTTGASPPVKRAKNATNVTETNNQAPDRRPGSSSSMSTRRTKSTATPTPAKPKTPARSTRLQEQEAASEDASKGYTGPPPRVLFSNSTVQPTSQHVKYLKKHGGTVVDSVSDGCNILCVRPAMPLSRTLKLLQCIALGIPIVTDRWLFDSASPSSSTTPDSPFLPLAPYMPHVPDQERELNFSVQKIWNKSHAELFKGWNIVFTPSSKQIYDAFWTVRDLVAAVGGTVVIPKRDRPDPKLKDKTIVLAQDEEDELGKELADGGWLCYYKDLLTLSILRGALDLESPEFRVGAPSGPAEDGEGETTEDEQEGLVEEKNDDDNGDGEEKETSPPSRGGAASGRGRGRGRGRKKARGYGRGWGRNRVA